MAFLIENLHVYQRAIDFTEAIDQITKRFPHRQSYISDQLNRAALSIAANLAEGNGRYHKADRANFFRIGRGSTFECVALIEVCKRTGIISIQEHALLYAQLEEISKMISGLLK